MDDVFELIDEYRRSHAEEAWSGTFRDYLPMVIENPRLARRAHERLWDMIRERGSEVDEQTGVERYRFFGDDLFGVDEAVAQVVEYFKAAAMGSDVRRRILLLYGPPSSGKSELVILLKRGLEEYSRTAEGAIYAIADCPQHEDPLHLIPHRLRPEFRQRYGIDIEGELCPRCALELKESYEGDIYRVPVQRIFLSEKDRVGIGTFVPSDPKSQDISELVGSLDLARIGEYGAESDPRAYRFDGELNIANRGLMEFIEMLKADPRFLYVLLTLAQERNIKTGRFPLIYADECVVAHTNEVEYQQFLSDETSQALRDRMIAVRFPYNLKLSEEVRIYRKLLSQSNLHGVHIAPHTLEVASMFAIMTRLEDSNRPGLSRVKKMHLYNGDEVEGYSSRDVKKIRAESENEGMFGISPRFVMNRIAAAFTRPGVTCVNPIDILLSLKEGVDDLAELGREKREEYEQLIADARREYDEIARTDVQKAFFVSFEDEIRTLLDNYLDNVEAYLEHARISDPITGEEREPDERLMRSIEEKVAVSESGKDAFRNEIMRKVAIADRRGERFDYTSHEKLRTALERQLFDERRDTIRLTVTSRNPDEEELKRINQVVDTLTQREGYCATCANELLKYVSSLLSREK
ncbi:MAG: protein prkA [Bacillota bacterium]|nr:protein prkA [Bacillota bacterium]